MAGTNTMRAAAARSGARWSSLPWPHRPRHLRTIPKTAESRTMLRCRAAFAQCQVGDPGHRGRRGLVGSRQRARPFGRGTAEVRRGRCAASGFLTSGSRPASPNKAHTDQRGRCAPVISRGSTTLGTRTCVSVHQFAERPACSRAVNQAATRLASLADLPSASFVWRAAFHPC
jgi:hypothetical protein